MPTTEKIVAPFTHEQVEALNAFQAQDTTHPFTCAISAHSKPLVATLDGWVCPEDDCNYTQDWAHGHMVDASTS